MLSLNYVKNIHICVMDVANKLIGWYKKWGRELPWREVSDPYIIWLSEIILQQTRVEQGLPYFNSFVTRFPTVKDFASASEEEVLRLWQGLGYYSRARNMHKTAKRVVEEFNAVFPVRYDSLIKLSGVGDYTASAISSFSSNERRAVLDGNVFRVLSRYFGIDTPINSTEGKKQFKAIADELIPEHEPGVYNQAIMDFGALVCKPKSPLCDECVLMPGCAARLSGRIHELPVKNKGKGSRNRYFHYFVWEKDGLILMSKRGQHDVWANLYEFPMIETEREADAGDLLHNSDFNRFFGEAQLNQVGGVVKHVLSHQNIYARFYCLSGINDIKEKKVEWDYYLSENLDKLAKHKLVFSFINKYLLAN